MPELHRKTKPGRYGTVPEFVDGAVAATNSGTATTLIPLPRLDLYVNSATVTLTTLGSSTGTILLKVQAVGTDGSTARDLTGTLSLESDGVATALVPVNLPITATGISRTLKRGETLRLSVTSSTTNTTAPVGSVALELFLLE